MARNVSTAARSLVEVNLPPGPPGGLFRGNPWWRNRDPLSVLRRWASEYGDIFTYRNFFVQVYFLNHPDYIEQVLVRASARFMKGRGLQANRRIFGNGLLTSEGEVWKRQRRLAQPAFHRERIAAYAGLMVDYARRMMASWREGETRDIHRDLMKLTLEIAARALFSTGVDKDVDRIGNAVNDIILQNAGGRMLVPVLRSLPTPSYLRYRRAIRRLEAIVYGIIRRKREHPEDGEDLLSMLLAARDEDGRPMDDRQLRDEAVTLLLAGHETTALALSWTWFLLSENPEVEMKFAAELRAVLGGREPTLEDLRRLPYTEKIVKESMRLYPPAYAIARVARVDCPIGRYVVPEGASVVLSPWVTHRDARFFPDPERFRPERWTEEFEARLPRFAYFPFGGGPRVCIGASFALLEAGLLLATIGQRFRLRLAPGVVPEPLASITLRPRNGIRMIVGRWD